MLKLRKYLKPFIFGLLLAVCLLFVQAFSDLNLPNYMSDIVNVGIQQSGIERSTPDQIAKKDFDMATQFMSTSDKALVEKNFTYDKAENKYVLNKNIPDQTMTELDAAFGKATWSMLYVKKDNLTPAKAIAQSEKLDKAFLDQSGPVMVKQYYKNLGIDMNKYQSKYILKIGIIMLIISLIGGIASIFVSLISSRIASGVARNLRKDLFTKIESFSNEEFDEFSTASLITRSTNDVMQIQTLLVMGIRMLCYAPIMAIGGIVMALDKSVSMGWIIIIAVVALIGLILVVFSLALPRFKIMQKLVDRVNLVAREGLNGLLVIRAFGNENFEKNRFDIANLDLTKVNLFVNRVMAIMMPLMMFIMNGICVLVIWVGSHQVADSNMQVGDMMAFMQYAMQVIMSFFFISMMFIFIPRAAVSAERIFQVLDTEPKIVDPEFPKEMDPSKKGYVEFKDVCFKYHGADEYAIKNISFYAKPGQTTAIIGATGSGKTTLANLIPRFYDATCGQVLVNGIDVKDVRQSDLRSQIGYVPQKTVLMSGTIESNIKFGKKDISDEKMENAATIAQAYDFIKDKDQGFQEEIAQGGTNVSGGQKQRLSIARALAIDPNIFIFDDSFSALDYKTDAMLRKALKENTEDATVIIIAQRVSTIIDADIILVIDDGEIISRGTHKELLNCCPEYGEIVSTQISEKEAKENGK